MTQTAAAKTSRWSLSSLKGKVVLVVGAYRCEATVAETFHSLLSQGPALDCLRHVLLTDDCGGDRTYEVGKKLWKHEVPLVLHDCKKNQGEYRNINGIVDALPAGVEWIVILHGDNAAKEGWLESILGQLVNAHPDLATLSTSWDDLKEDGTIVPGAPEPDPNYREYRGTRETMRDTLYSGCWWHISSCAIRVSAFKKVGGLPANGMRHKGDWLLLTKFLDQGFRVGYIPKSLMLYRRNPEGSSSLSYRATGDILEALYVIGQFNHRLRVREILHLHRQLVHNVLSRALKALAVGRIGHLFSLLARTFGIVFNAAVSCGRVVFHSPKGN